MREGRGPGVVGTCSVGYNKTFSSLLYASPTHHTQPQVFCLAVLMHSGQQDTDGKDHQSLKKYMLAQGAGKIPLTLGPISFLLLATSQSVWIDFEC